MTLEQQQLAAALAACRLKDEALVLAGAANAWQNFGECRAFTKERIPSPREVDDTIKSALTIQPDDAALMAWLGDPIGEVKKHTGSLKDMAIIVWSCDQPAEGTKLYSPKGLK